MRTAVIITGEARTFAACWKTQAWHVWRKLQAPHFFVSVADDVNAAALWKLKEIFGVENVTVEVVNPRPDELELPPEGAQDGAPFYVHPDLRRVIEQWWRLQRGWKLMAEHGDVFDPVIRMRPDAYFIKCEPLEIMKQETRKPGKGIVCTPWWARWGGVNDRFAVMDMAGAEVYFNLIEAWPVLLAQGCPFHSETMMAANLHRHGVMVIERLEAEFALQRMDGTRQYPESEMTRSDQHHFDLN
jgi:hypothetical protein